MYFFMDYIRKPNTEHQVCLMLYIGYYLKIDFLPRESIFKNILISLIRSYTAVFDKCMDLQGIFEYIIEKTGL